MQSGILFLVSIERGGSRRVYDRGPLLSDVSQLGDAPCRCLARVAVVRVGVVGPKRAEDFDGRRAKSAACQKVAAAGSEKNEHPSCLFTTTCPGLILTATRKPVSLHPPRKIGRGDHADDSSHKTGPFVRLGGD